jgi:type II secretory pathway pseudopilin PulG
MKSFSSRGAFTLLEVVLALSLTVLVTAILGMAIHVHLRSIDKAQVSIERDQLARTLLRRIADDVRSAIRREPFDTAGLQSLLQSAKNAGKTLAGAAGQTADAGKSGDSSTTTGGTGRAGTASAAGTTSAAGTATSLTPSNAATTGDTGDAAAGTPAAVPGLYGTQYDLQIDVGRIPRLDELTGAATAGVPLPSDVRSVYYFVAGTMGGVPVNGERGLMRSEMNRAAALYLAENGDFSSMVQMAESLAAEVVGLEFRYFDGLQWYTEWSSDTMGGLPLAVEITLVVIEPRAADAEMATAGVLDLTTVRPDQIYTTTVHLPNAQLPQSSGGAAGGSSDSGITDLGTSSTGSSSGGGSKQ